MSAAVDNDDYGLNSSDEFDLRSDDDFGLSSSDEAELVALADASAQSLKRKASFKDETRPGKKLSTESLQAIPLAVKALTRDFGLKTFRLKQEQVISRILDGGSATVVFPTGGGKSLCYQIPALVFSELDKLAGRRGERDGGITLVVSPLIALMKDQVDSLVRRGIKAAVLDSTKTREEYLRTVEMLRNGELKLLYCAPERLNNEVFVQSMAQVRGGIRLVAVDEAHCISEWGHAFRPDYLKISRFVKEIKAERVICLTATATPRVAKDICAAFDIDEGMGLFRSSTYRPNLRLLAESAITKQDLYPRLFGFLAANPGATIVYVTLQKQTEALAKDLRNQGFNAKAFHAGMNTVTKTSLQEEFMGCEDLIIVATIAFGMGIDKASIRNVVHFNIPNSIESYSQEIGRAGRDGKPSTCMFYVCAEDLYLRELFARGDLPSRESLCALLRNIFDTETTALPVGSELKRSHLEQQKDYDIRQTTLANIYAQLELRHGLIRASTPIYTKYSFKAGYLFSSKLLSDESAVARAIKLSAKPNKSVTYIDIDAASSAFNLPRADFIRKLNGWAEENIIELRTNGVVNAYKVLKPLPRSPDEVEKVVSDIYNLMQKREQEALDRTEAMLALVIDSKCFSWSLSNYFGDDLPDRKKECGHCTWCETHRVIIKPVPPVVPFNRNAFRSVLEAVKDRDDARFLARIAFGITSPRVAAQKLGKHAVFASMDDHEFMDLLAAFTAECSKVNQAGCLSTPKSYADQTRGPPTSDLHAKQSRCVTPV